MKIWPKYYYYKKDSLKKLFGFLDMILFFGGGLKSKKLKVSDNDKVLVINLGGIGDVVLTEPFFRSLNLAGAEVWCLVSPLTSELLPNYVKLVFFSVPWLSRNGKKLRLSAWIKLLIKLKKEKFTLAVDLKGDPFIILSLWLLGVKNRVGFVNGGLGALLNNGIETDRNVHKSLLNLQLLDLPGLTDNSPRIGVGDIQKDIDVMLHIHTGSDKNWSMDNWKQLINRLTDKKIAIIGGASTAEQNSINELVEGLDITVFSGFKIAEAVKVIARAKVLVGVDSGPAHIASALGVPVISIFSLVNNPIQWAPVGSKVFVFNQGENNESGENYEKATPDNVKMAIDNFLDIKQS